ncbi:MAG: TonB-dependent receptor [Saprospiraceae bacterium]|nr:TonB-dependent receptor [Saprospiraceae bacterium]
MKKLCILTLCLFTVFSAIFSQKIVGIIADPTGKPQEFANALVLNAKDSSLVKGAVSDEKGHFEIEGLTAHTEGGYFLQISMVGFQNFVSEKFDGKSDKDFGTITLKTLDQELNQVTVTAKKPTFEMKADKMVMNVEGNINTTGNSAIEILRKAPGVLVDKDENISLKGKSGVRIYIDGRPSQMAGKDLAAILRGLNANDIEAIEIITNPSAKYDASGNAGIINIRLKKNRKVGTNGNISLGVSYGQSLKLNEGLNLNYRDRKVNVFGNYSFWKGRWDDETYILREQSGLQFNQSSPNFNRGTGHNIKAGTDFFLNSKNTLGVLITGNLNDGYWESNSRTLISKVGSSKVDSILIAQNQQPENRTNLTYNINYRFADTSGHELNIDADYGTFKGTGSSYQPNYYKNADETQILTSKIYRNSTPTDIVIKTLKTDYEQNLWKGKLGVGFKVSDVKTDNTFDFFNVYKDADVKDDDRSNRFTYDERVSAAYVNYNCPLSKKISLQVGLRGEQTKSLGQLFATKQSNDKAVDTSYFNLFPSGSLSYNVGKNYSVSASYSRRIERPRYQDLNPFEYKLDELTYRKGNPFLRPAFTQSFEINQTIMQAVNVGLSYSLQRDVMSDILDTTEATKTFQITTNIAKQQNYSLNISSPLPITKWWEGFVNIWVNHVIYKSTNSATFPIDASATQFGFYSEHTIKFGKGWSGQISGWFNSPQLWGGVMKMRSQGMVDIGLQKKFWNDNATVKLTFGDLLNTSSWSGVGIVDAFKFNIHGGWEGQIARLNFNYRFGSNEIKSARERRTGLEDEKSRIKGKN